MRFDETTAKMEVSDLDEVVELDTSSRLTPWSRPSFLEELKNPFSYCYTLRRRRGSHDQIVGIICFRILDEESELLILAIHPQYRQQGLGRKLMKFYFDFCSRKKVETFYLEAGAFNQPAIRLYQSFAYQPIGKRPNYYQGKEDALLLLRRASHEGFENRTGRLDLVFDDPRRDKKQ